MKRYTKYKNSGIKWIGNIPAVWDVSKVKYFFSIILGKMLQPNKEHDDDKLLDYLCSVNITWNGVNLSEIRQMWFSPQEIEKYRLQKGDLLVTEGGDVAVSSFWNNELDECYIQNAIHLVRSKGIGSIRFLFYWLQFLKYNGYIDLICNKATIAHFTKDKLGNLPIFCFSSDEQAAIAAYLDRRTTKIDALLADLQSQADLLDRYKRELIAEVVIHGLDKTAPRKDSGVEWIGDIPTNWEVIPLRAVAKDNTTKNYWMQCDNLLSLSHGKIIHKDIDTNFGLLPENFENYQIVQEGYTVLRLTDLQNDKRSLRTGYVSETGIITSAYTGLIPSKQIDGKYFAYLLHTYDLKKIYYGLGGGVRQSLKYNDLKTLPILIPQMADQKAIVAYINDKTVQVNGLIADINRQIEKLKQYRQIVIHDAVTGKIKVTKGANDAD